MNCRRNINKVNPNSAGLPPKSQLSEARVYDHRTPSLQTLLYEAKKFQQQYSYKFCWVRNSIKNPFTQYDDSRAVVIRKLTDFVDLAGQGGQYMLWIFHFAI